MLITIFIILNLLDTVITLYALKVGLHEKNPLLKFIIKHVGLIGFCLAKLGVIGVVVYFATDFDLESLVILNIIYTLIVLNNTLKLYITRKK